MPLKDALAYSKNTITAQLTIDIGPGEVVDFARRMGIQSELDPVPSIGLGTSEVSLLEMTAAYGTIANYGQYRDPVFITRIEDHSGSVIARFSDSGGHQAIPASVAYTVLDMMRGVADFGTGVRIRNQYEVRDDVAAKTGTSQNGADGWFMLMHPNMVMGAWVGFATPALYFRSDYWAQGAHTALPIVGKFYSAAKSAAPDVLDGESRFNPPPGWVEPQPVDTTWDAFDDENARYASYLDSISMARDSIYSSDDSTWRYENEWEGDLDGLSEDTLAIGEEEEETRSDDVESVEYEDIEDVEAADSLNRIEQVGPLPLDGNGDDVSDGEASEGGDGAREDGGGENRGW
jgi:membrane peptidoglycan carboxypeptidase